MTKFGLVFLLFAFASLAAATDVASSEPSLAEAKQLLEEESYADAADILDNAIASLRAEQGGDTLETIQLLLLAARAYDGLGKTKPSNRYFDAAIELLLQSPSEVEADLLVQTYSALESASSKRRDRKRLKQLTAVYDIATDVMIKSDLRLVSMATKLGRRNRSEGRDKDAMAILDQAYALLIGAEFVDPDPIGAELIALAAEYAQHDRLETADELVKIAAAIGASTDEATAMRRVAPVYPSGCLAAGISGEVDLTIGVDAKGRVLDVKVIEVTNWRGSNKKKVDSEACRKDMERAATTVASQFLYIPKLENGVPAISEVEKTMVTFELE